MSGDQILRSPETIMAKKFSQAVIGLFLIEITKDGVVKKHAWTAGETS
jgi:hypothetical protein